LGVWAVLLNRSGIALPKTTGQDYRSRLPVKTTGTWATGPAQHSAPFIRATDRSKRGAMVDATKTSATGNGLQLDNSTWRGLPVARQMPHRLNRFGGHCDQFFHWFGQWQRGGRQPVRPVCLWSGRFIRRRV